MATKVGKFVRAGVRGGFWAAFALSDGTNDTAVGALFLAPQP